MAPTLEWPYPEVLRFHLDWFMETVRVDPDHVHVYMLIPSKYAALKEVKMLKSVTSKQVKEKFQHIIVKL